MNSKQILIIGIIICLIILLIFSISSTITYFKNYDTFWIKERTPSSDLSIEEQQDGIDSIEMVKIINIVANRK